MSQHFFQLFFYPPTATKQRKIISSKTRALSSPSSLPSTGIAMAEAVAATSPLMMAVNRIKESVLHVVSQVRVKRHQKHQHKMQAVAGWLVS